MKKIVLFSLLLICIFAFSLPAFAMKIGGPSFAWPGAVTIAKGSWGMGLGFDYFSIGGISYNVVSGGVNYGLIKGFDGRFGISTVNGGGLTGTGIHLGGKYQFRGLDDEPCDMAVDVPVSIYNVQGLSINQFGANLVWSRKYNNFTPSVSFGINNLSGAFPETNYPLVLGLSVDKVAPNLDLYGRTGATFGGNNAGGTPVHMAVGMRMKF